MTFYIDSSIDVKNTHITLVISIADVIEHLKRVKHQTYYINCSWNQCNMILITSVVCNNYIGCGYNP